MYVYINTHFYIIFYFIFLVNFNKAWHSKIQVQHSSSETDRDDVVVSKKRPLFDNSSDENDDLGNN